MKLTERKLRRMIRQELNEVNLTTVREYRDFKYAVKRMVDRYISSELDDGNQMTGNYLIGRTHQKLSEMMYNIIQEYIYDQRL